MSLRPEAAAGLTFNQPVSAEVGFESFDLYRKKMHLQCNLILSMAQVRSSISLYLVTMKTRKENLLIYPYWDRELIRRFKLMAPTCQCDYLSNWHWHPIGYPTSLFRGFF